MSNKHQEWLSSNSLTEYPNDRILVLNSVGTVDSEHPVKVKIKGNAQWLNKWEFAAPTSKLNKQTPRDLEKEVYDGNITDNQNGTDAIRVSELNKSRQR